MFGSSRNSLFRRTRGGIAVRHPAGLDIVLRPLMAEDRERLAAHLMRLSPADRRTRFFHQTSDEAIARYCGRIDWKTAYLVGAVVEDTLRGVGELVPEGEDGAAEIAVTVEEGWRHAALGRILVAALLVVAEENGLRSAKLLFLHENEAMRRLVSDIGARLGSASGVTEALVDLGPDML